MRNKRELWADAERLVDQIVKVLTGARRDIALNLARKAILGHPTMSNAAVDSLLQPGQIHNDMSAAIWDCADTIFSNQAARYRVLVGRLVSVCGEPYALKVLNEVAAAHDVSDPSNYIAGAIGKYAKDQEQEDFAPATECHFGEMKHHGPDE